MAAEPIEKAEKARRDRELIELLSELRVTLPGVQILFAFLLVVPFSARFADVTPLQRWVYFFALLCTAVATVFLTAPTAHHRLLWRRQLGEHRLRAANRFAIAGTIFLALAMSGVLFLIADFIFGFFAAVVFTVFIVGLFAWLWYGWPIFYRLRN